MTPDPDPEVLAAAEAIADGSPVEWDGLAATDRSETGIVPRLRMVERIAIAHRSLSASADETVEEATGKPARPERWSWGPLEVQELLGTGGFGAVYRAFDPRLQRPVALKLLRSGSIDSESFTRLVDEARRLARVRHPGVLTVYGVEEHDGRVGIWMDLVRGRTLEECLARQGPMGAGEAGHIGIELCRALAAVHQAGLIHRDIKTSNVMREEGGRIVLMDFGSGRDFVPGGDPLVSVHLHGTPIAMAPEQLRGEISGPPTDIYGLGVLLYRLLTGRYPIEAANLHEILEAHRTGRLVPLRDRRPDLPHALVGVVERALAPEPSRRFATAGELERALGDALAGNLGSGSAAGGGVPEPARASAAWQRAAWIGGIAAVLAIAIILVWKSAERSTPIAVTDGSDAATTPSGAGDPIGPVAGIRAPEIGSDRAGMKPRAEVPATRAEAPVGRNAPPPPVTDAAPRSPTGGIVASAELIRRRDGVEERLLPDARIGPGDGLSLIVEAPRSLYYYVLNEDESGLLHVLFPLPGLETRNPIPAGSRQRLPGRIEGREIEWKVTAPGGAETVLVIASAAPLQALERDMARLPHASFAAPVPVSALTPETMRSLRSIAGLAEIPASSGGGTGRLSEALASVSQRSDDAERPWIWQTRLSNPRP